MSLPATISKTVLDTVLGHLASLFLTATFGDVTAARDTACQLLAEYNVATKQEFCLAAEIISLRLHTLKALNDATDPNLSLNQQLRLRGSVVSLSREAHKSQRKLDQLQRGRAAEAPVQPEAMPVAPDPTKIGQDVLAAVQKAVQTVGKQRVESWSQSFQKRQTAKRIADNLRKNQTQFGNPPAPLNAEGPAAA